VTGFDWVAGNLTAENTEERRGSGEFVAHGVKVCGLTLTQLSD